MKSSVYPVFHLPNLEYLRKHAKDRKKLLQEGDPEVLEWYRQIFPADDTPVALQKVQHIIAVEQGFKSWTELVHHLEPPEYPKSLQSFIGDDRRLKAWPVKRGKQLAFLEIIASRIRPGVKYTEQQFNTVLHCYHSFNDPARLRRDMLGYGMIKRKIDGSDYQRV